jgi:uncharacterized membrane protein YphA (DoxX/SURF4 family)
MGDKYQKTTTVYLELLSVLLGIVYLASGIGKAFDAKGFSNLVASCGFSNLSPLSPILIISELALSFALILRIYTKEMAYLSCLTLIIFTLLYGYALAFNSNEKYGCSGIINIDIKPILVFICHLAMIGISILLILYYPASQFSIPFWKKTIFIFALISSSYTIGFTQRTPLQIINDSTECKVIEFVGKKIAETPLQKFISTNSDSIYMVYCFSYGCPHCLNSMENIKEYPKNKIVDRIVLVGTGDEESRNEFHRDFNVPFVCIDIAESEMLQITKAFPTTFFVIQNTIKYRMEGTLPVYQNLRKMNLLNRN